MKIWFTKVIVPNSKYNEAVELMNSGEYDASYKIFNSYGAYRDSLKLVESIKEEHPFTGDVGDTVFFGDGNTWKIEWLILAKENGKTHNK